MPPDSVIISDDILWNRAFIEFVRTFELLHWICASYASYGVALNTLHPQEQGIVWGHQKPVYYMDAL